ncbi:hypothetical protein [Sinorhizobium fredii]|uniref:hypothetical protein n=1 Tax=Rhizobium fredii TaxID=380 RepID=UPI003CE46191
MREISKARFNAIGGYARHPRAHVIGEELTFFEDEGGALLGLLVRDRSDGDYAGMAFGRDKRLRFRWTAMTGWLETPKAAIDALGNLIAELRAKPDEFHHQGDEVGEPVDFFTPVHPSERLHPDFLNVTASEEFSSARGIIEPMMRWHEDLDGNFVEQFQSTAFDQRIWELYLFAMLTELGYVLDQSHAVPDYIAGGLSGQVAIEAVTVGPTRHGNSVVPPPPTETAEELDAYLRHYMPIKFGSPLFTKLRKEYWKHPQVADMPLVFAIADFSSPGSMARTRSSLERYLYGFSLETVANSDGTTSQKPVKITEHKWGQKTIPSGFFDIPEAENISAVISTTSETISKFNRLGLLSGFGADNVLMTREGTCIQSGLGAMETLLFKAIVNAKEYTEAWVEGLDVYHNPRAQTPLPERLLPGAAHYRCDAVGNVTCSTPRFHPLASTTRVIANVDVAKVLRESAGEAIRVWKPATEA